MHSESLQLAAAELHKRTREPASAVASIGQQRLTRSQLAPHPASAFPPLLLEDALAPLELLLDEAFAPLELLLDPVRPPLLEPPLLEAAAVPSKLPTPSSDPTTAPSPPMLLTPASSPAVFGELLHAANAKTATLHTAPSSKTFAIALCRPNSNRRRPPAKDLADGDGLSGDAIMPNVLNAISK
jgi:hypothetical protein